MKKIYLGMLAVCTLLLTSCHFTENIYINENGSGKVSFEMDGSELMSMMGDEMSADKEETAIDSIISFKDIFDEQRDSISKLSPEEQAKLKSLEQFNLHMVMSSKEKKMNMDMYADFTSVAELEDMFKAMNAAGSLNKNQASQAGNPLASLGDDRFTQTDYSMEENMFKRTVTILDQARVDSLSQNLGQAQMMFASSSYKLNYHFPKKIKSVSLENAVMGEDGKSFSVEVNFMEYIKNPKLLNLEVELEQ